jgi:predicted RNA-binding Zn-ribbon protein involved in translation (DUF1610 family)
MAFACLTCHVPLLARVETHEVDGNQFWCPSCGRNYERIEKLDRFAVRRRLPQHLLARPSTLRWTGRLNADGSIDFVCSGTGTAEEARRAGDALNHLASRSEDRLEQLRGADRWLFRRERTQGRETFFAKIHDEECGLVPWRSGGRRPDPRGRTLPEQTCDACKAELPRGARGYRGAREGDALTPLGRLT